MPYTQARVNAALDAANNNVAWCVLHTGSPGANGTEDQAAGVDPESITLPSASNGESSEEVTFDIPGAGGPFTHISLWTNSGGSPDTFVGSGALSPQESFAGPGTLDVTVTTSASSN